MTYNFYPVFWLCSQRKKNTKTNTFAVIRNLYPLNESSCSIIALEWW